MTPVRDLDTDYPPCVVSRLSSTPSIGGKAACASRRWLLVAITGRADCTESVAP